MPSRALVVTLLGLSTSCGSRTSVELPAYGESDAEPGDAGSPSSGGSSSGGGSSSSSGGSTPDSGSIDATVCSSPGVVCGGACVDVHTDNSNCGGCGIACGGTCAGGRCTVQLSSVGDFRGPIAVDSTSVYWATQFGNAVMKVPLGGGATTTLAALQGGPVGLAVDTTSVYFTEDNLGPSALPGAVVQMPLQGGAQTTLSSYGVPGAIAVAATGPVWVETSWIVSAPIGGGAPSTLATVTAPWPITCGLLFGGLALAPTSAVWTTSDIETQASATLYETPLDGGASTQLAMGGTIVAVAADATSVYWTGGVLQTSGVYLIPMGAVMKAPLAGGTPVTLASASLSPWGGMAVDEASVYYAEVDGSSASTGAVMKVPIGGGTPVTLSAGVSASGIAVDATSVYFLAESGVFKVTPK